MNVNLRSLIGRLNDTTRNAVESAAGLCLSRTHYDVELEHYLLKLLDSSDSDLALILRHYEVNRSRLATDLSTSMDRLKSGNARTPSLSPSLVKMLSEAWTLGSLDFGAGQIRSGHTILALVASEELGRMIRGSTMSPRWSVARTSLPLIDQGFSSLWFSVRSTRPIDS